MLKVVTDMETCTPKKVVSQLCSEYKISGRDISTIKFLRLKDAIVINDDGKALYTMDHDELRELIKDKPKAEKKAKKKSMAAIESVESVISQEVAQEAHDRSARYFQIGKEVAGAAWAYYEKLGIPMSEAAKYPFEVMIPDALEKATDYDALYQKHVIAENTIAQLSALADPFGRLNIAIIRLKEFAEYAAICEKLGFPWRDTPVSKLYNILLNKLIVGD